MKLRFLLPVLLISAAVAQLPPSPAGPHLAPLTAIKDYLNLTDSQVQALQQLRRTQFDSVKPIAQQLSEKQKALHEMLDKGTADATSAGALLLEIEALKKQLKQGHEGLSEKARNILTPDQLAKLKALEEAEKLQPALHQAMMLGLLQRPGLIMGRGVGQAMGMAVRDFLVPLELGAPPMGPNGGPMMGPMGGGMGPR